jgi:hypothetical protein
VKHNGLRARKGKIRPNPEVQRFRLDDRNVLKAGVFVPGIRVVHLLRVPANGMFTESSQVDG